jgi:hypothetical protein
MRNLSLGALLLTGAFVAGCTGPSIWEPMPQSNFAYPNSNVTQLDHVKASVSRTYLLPFQNVNFMDATQKQEAYNAALQRSGGDLIIDGNYTVRSKIVPLFIVTSITVEGTVEGTAAKMVVGSRNLNNRNSKSI